MARILIAAGGTAGHVVPALAVADALRTEGAEVHFAGGERAEARARARGGLPVPPAARGGARPAQPAEGRAGRGARCAGARQRARRLIREIDADVVLGGGGYVAGPAGLAAASQRVPLALTEADSHLGIANRMLARFARNASSSRSRSRGASGERYEVTGRPVPPGTGGGRPRRGARAASASAPTSAACSCSAARSARGRLNEAAIEAFGRAAPFAVLHACGRARPRRAARAASPSWATPPHYRLEPYVEPFADAYAAADLAVARAGRLGVRARRRRRARDPRPVSPRHRRPPDRQRALDGATAGAAVVVRDDGARPPRRSRARSTPCSAIAERLRAMAAAARAGAPGRRRADRRRPDRPGARPSRNWRRLCRPHFGPLCPRPRFQRETLGNKTLEPQRPRGIARQGVMNRSSATAAPADSRAQGFRTPLDRTDRGTTTASTLQFEAGPEAAAAARNALLAPRGPRLDAELLADVRLLVSELVTNSVRHSNDPTSGDAVTLRRGGHRRRSCAWRSPTAARASCRSRATGPSKAVRLGPLPRRPPRRPLGRRSATTSRASGSRSTARAARPRSGLAAESVSAARDRAGSSTISSRSSSRVSRSTRWIISLPAPARAGGLLAGAGVGRDQQAQPGRVHEVELLRSRTSRAAAPGLERARSSSSSRGAVEMSSSPRAARGPCRRAPRLSLRSGLGIGHGGCGHSPRARQHRMRAPARSAPPECRRR